MKMLITQPGHLTVAYWNKQRARYIPPISLYIFISTAYFLGMYLLTPVATKQFKKSHLGKMTDSSISSAYQHNVKSTSPTNKESTIVERNSNKNVQQLKPFFDKIMHNQPKVFFFMVPFMALLLKVLFSGRKDIYFGDHAVYSLHFHTTAFLLSFIEMIVLCFVFIPVVTLLFYFVLIIFSVAGLSYVYKISTGKAIWYSLVMGAIFIFVSVIVSIGLMYITDREMLTGVFKN